MYIFILSQQILRDLWMHKLRSLLALFGITWGTLTVILLLALGYGFYTTSKINMMKIVDGTFFVNLNKTSKPFMGYPVGRQIKIKPKTIMDLPNIMHNDIQLVSPIMSQNINISFQDKQFSREVSGVNSDLAIIRKVDLTPDSRFISPIDEKTAADVVVIGYHLKQQLFNDAPAIGKKILIRHIPFTVIGIMPNPGHHNYSWYDNSALIPYTTFINLWGEQDVNSFFIVPNPKANSQEVKQTLINYLAARYHFDPQDTAALRIYDTVKMFKFFTWFFVGIQIFLGICGALTLAVGSLGVANIMFLIVTERTREIGIKMAVGARDYHILFQILLETLMIIILGGLLGFLIATSCIIMLQYIPLPTWLGQPEISMITVFITIIILMLFGLLAGYFPAKRAANMDPIEAINFK